MVQTTGADPARRPLEGMQGRQQQVATLPGTGPAGVDQPFGLPDGDRPEAGDGPATAAFSASVASSVAPK